MTIYPAIDLKGARVVRLHQGRADAETVYGNDPASVARDWVGQGAQWLHVVDLDGAFSGVPRNWDCVRAVLSAVSNPVQLGGGLRTRQQIADALAMGVSRCVVGTKACEPSFVKSLVAEFGEKIAVGIDARDGFVAVKGWVERTSLPAVEFARQISNLSVRTIIFTDIATDGALTGPNLKAVSGVCAAVKCDIIASGGVSTADDVRKLRELKHRNLIGVIIGKALYDGRVQLKDVL